MSEGGDQEIVKTWLENGAIIYVQATDLGGEQDIAFMPASFSNITHALEGIAGSIMRTLDKVKPQKASVEFGLEVALDAGQLTGLLVKGSSNANLKITLEWCKLEAEELEIKS